MAAADPYAKFLLHCLRQQAHSLPASPDWNWAKFIEAASVEMLTPAIYGLLAKQQLVEYLPADVGDFFFAARELNRQRNREILERIEILASAFNAVGIEPLLLKGAAYLLSGVYADPGDRFLVDIDFLVTREEIPAALEILGQHGYSFDRVDPIDHATNHTFAVFSRSDSMTVDLHQTVGLGASSDVLPTVEILDRSQVLMLGHAGVRIPCPTDLLTHHILHSQVHELYRDRIWTPLRSLYDLALLQQRFSAQADWQRIVWRFKQRRLYGSLILYLMLVRKMIGTAPPIALRPGPLVMMRWQHRQLLRRMPKMRFVDPFWFYSAGVEPRIRRLRSILQEPGGIRYLLRKLFSVDFFLRLKTDLS
jgi:hypothetical protein